ncbi:MAG: methionine--tRNA ligase [Bacteroidales bacterium]|nr:methionine--tRNA ligase [Bacteroidales bacterium]MCF8343502.1 methionine--tRNA ligase [Bacteroidales bacterium]MCF8349755.1 methionine--tRNA ligase [Bacteroidales bacterium]MCF8376274.1 methionine--tRNA ligase [Bacteroidales bacterium]MCF8401569.1 methionine--tRNA ligase [Bacteroidales bacterium]
MGDKKTFKRHTITSALPYANGPIHIGHLAGVYVPADIYVRYLRLKGEEVIFIGGSDEHGVPITIKARQLGVTPQEIVDKYHGMIKRSFQEFGISFDVYSRTSAPIHHETASDFFKTLYDKGEFIEKTSEHYFDQEARQFLADRYITGTCPHCGYEKAYGDQCENCGTSLSPTELINPKSALSGNIPKLKETKHWYLPLDKYEGELREWILEGHKDDWKPNVYGQCKSWIEQGLQPRAVTRDLDWGVKVPLPNTEGKVLYVWFDAPIGYISATRQWAEETGEDWEKWWKDPQSRLIHFIGKDNIVFHCIIFPSILRHEGNYILPENVPAFEFLNLEGDKISTSRNWAVWLHEYLEEFPGKEDVLRYVLTSNAPETKDNDFTWKDFQAKNNNELLAIFGNFVNRTIILTHKYFDGKVPGLNELKDEDKKVIESLKTFPDRIGGSLDKFKFREALAGMMNLARLGNKYLTDTEPWKLFKSDPGRVKAILNISLQICANLSVLASPFLPHTCAKLRKMLNIGKLQWDRAGSVEILESGREINKAQYLFENIDDATIEKQVQKLLNTKKSNEGVIVNPSKDNIVFDDFVKMDIRTATILEAEKVPKTKKLLKLKVDTGLDQRTVVSGIAEYYIPEDCIGKKVCMIVNLEARKIRGIESQGMILMAENQEGKLSFVSPEKDFPNGSEVK